VRARLLERELDAAQSVDQPARVRVAAAPDAPLRERLDLRDGPMAALRDHLEEAAIELGRVRFEDRALLGGERAQPRHHVGMRCGTEAVGGDPEALDERCERELRRDHPDRPGDRQRLRDDATTGHRDVVAAARSDVAEVRDDRLLPVEAHDLAVDQLTRERGASGRVDVQHYGPGQRIGSRLAQCGHDAAAVSGRPQAASFLCDGTADPYDRDVARRVQRPPRTGAVIREVGARARPAAVGLILSFTALRARARRQLEARRRGRFERDLALERERRGTVERCYRGRRWRWEAHTVCRRRKARL
jgi:hypothetical protein